MARREAPSAGTPGTGDTKDSAALALSTIAESASAISAVPPAVSISVARISSRSRRRATSTTDAWPRTT
ncbi:hypothetical protein [Kribbella sp. VKM Ac-2569]|uniref:hypothetical protein n=1 Tax=Kribbella sp. VKM Ac-2569 TaxID=2512220 RepID=UPI0018E52043|nr:hypothetical protein [Kribbella sp. VKM Ac-2569]